MRQSAASVAITSQVNVVRKTLDGNTGVTDVAISRDNIPVTRE